MSIGLSFSNPIISFNIFNSENTSKPSRFNKLFSKCIYRIMLTISVASVEKSFSKLKLIKSYLRSTMSQQRLNKLTLLSNIF